MRERPLKLVQVAGAAAMLMAFACGGGGSKSTPPPPPKTITATVLDSINGVPVTSALITVTDSHGTVVQSAVPVDANGNASITLDGVSQYNISAVGTGTAVSMFAGFDSGRESAVNLFCHPLGMINFPAQAPQITALSYSANGTTWTPIPGNTVSAAWEKLAALQVTALGASNIAPTSWSGYGIALNIDQPVWMWQGVGPYAIEEQAVPVSSGGTTLYRSTMDLNLAFTNTVANATHDVDIVAYDVANNRTEEKLYMTVTDAVPVPGEPSIATAIPSSFAVQFVTHGLSRNIFSITPVNGTPISYEPDLFFSLTDASNNDLEITGFEVYRSTDGTTWTKLATQYFGGPVADPYYVQSLDDPTLKDGVTYYFRVRAFNDNPTNNGGFSQYSASVPCRFLAPFTDSLSAPANESISTSLTPSFSFSISNPALFDPQVSDFLYFYLYARDKTGSQGEYGQPYRYNFATSRFESEDASANWSDATGQVSIDVAHTTITIQGPAGYFQPGLTYEWTMYGTQSGTSADACSFVKLFSPTADPTGTDYGAAISSGSTYEKSYGAINGRFTLTIDPSAH